MGVPRATDSPVPHDIEAIDVGQARIHLAVGRAASMDVSRTRDGDRAELPQNVAKAAVFASRCPDGICSTQGV
jgi:maltoporin